MSTLARLLHLARPRGAALIAAVPLTGFGYGLWARGSTVSPRVVLPELTLLAATWLALHAGAMWLNAGLDRDAGPVLFGRPVEVPPAVGPAGYLALAASMALAWPLGLLPFGCSAGCALLAILYSHPRVALKGRPLGGPLVNAIGYGILSPIAGFAASDGIPTWRALLTLALSVLCILGAYFAAQAFQGADDQQRGYRTLVVTHGAAHTLYVAHLCLRVAALVAMLATILGIYPRLFLVTAPAWIAADRHLLAWRRTPEANAAGGLIARLALAVALSVVAAYTDHFWSLAHDRPGGGCGTAWVPEPLAAICARKPPL